jgi:ketosteroid isomerase-like protein
VLDGLLHDDSKLQDGTTFMGNHHLAALRTIIDAFNRHDLEEIMSHFTEDAVLEAPRGPEPWGRRFTGKAAVRDGLASRFTGIPNVHYGDDDHFVAGDRGVSEWTLTGTTTDGERIEVRGCDLWTFRDGLISRKDSFWKIRVG